MRNLFLWAFLLLSLIVGCINPSNPEKEKDNTQNVGNTTSTLQDLVDNSGDTVIDLSKHDITDYKASVTKPITIKNSPEGEMLDLDIKTSGVTLDDINASNINVSADVGSGDLTINDSHISNLLVAGGGSNSIHLLGTTTIENARITKADVRLATEGATSDKVRITSLKVEVNCHIEMNATTIDVVDVATSVEAIKLSGVTASNVKIANASSKIVVGNADTVIPKVTSNIAVTIVIPESVSSFDTPEVDGDGRIILEYEEDSDDDEDSDNGGSTGLNAVYLDPTSSDDDNTGESTESPVNSLDKAIELLNAKDRDYTGKTIYVMSSVEVTKDMDYPGLTFERTEGFGGSCLLNITEDVTITGVTVDGKELPTDGSYETGIFVNAGLTATLTNITVQNNTHGINFSSNTANTNVTISGTTTITENKTGIDLSIEDNTLTIAGGTITVKDNTEKNIKLFAAEPIEVSGEINENSEIGVYVNFTGAIAENASEYTDTDPEDYKGYFFVTHEVDENFNEYNLGEKLSKNDNYNWLMFDP